MKQCRFVKIFYLVSLCLGYHHLSALLSMVIKACSLYDTIAQLILFTGLLISLSDSGIQLSQARPDHLCEELRHGSIGKFKNRKDLVAFNGTRNSRCFHE